MKNIKKRIIAAAVAAATALTFAGCGKKQANGVTEIKEGAISYPIKTDETVTYWVRLPAALGTSVTNFGETEFAKEFIKRTGIKIEYKHPAAGEEAQNLDLLIASGELPDIIETDWLSKNPASMIKKKVIVRLNDYINHMPNLQKFLKEHPEIDKQIKTDDGDYTRR